MNTITIQGITFQVGEEYQNWYGTCKVLLIQDEQLQVEYIEAHNDPIKTGDIKTYPAAAQADTILKERKRAQQQIALDMSGHKNATIRFRKPYDPFTLGYLANKLDVFFQTPPSTHKSYGETFLRITGESLLSYLGKGYSMISNPNWWATSLRSSMNVPSEAILIRLILPDNANVGRNKMFVNNKEFMTGLLYRGFRPGFNASNKDKIRNILETKFGLTFDELGWFDEGFHEGSH